MDSDAELSKDGHRKEVIIKEEVPFDESQFHLRMDRDCMNGDDLASDNHVDIEDLWQQYFATTSALLGDGEALEQAFDFSRTEIPKTDAKKEVDVTSSEAYSHTGIDGSSSVESENSESDSEYERPHLGGQSSRCRPMADAIRTIQNLRRFEESNPDAGHALGFCKFDKHGNVIKNVISETITARKKSRNDPETQSAVFGGVTFKHGDSAEHDCTVCEEQRNEIVPNPLLSAFEGSLNRNEINRNRLTNGCAKSPQNITLLKKTESPPKMTAVASVKPNCPNDKPQTVVIPLQDLKPGEANRDPTDDFPQTGNVNKTTEMKCTGKKCHKLRKPIKKHPGRKVTWPVPVSTAMKYRSMGTEGCARVRLTAYISNYVHGSKRPGNPKMGFGVVMGTRKNPIPRHHTAPEQSKEKHSPNPRPSEKPCAKPKQRHQLLAATAGTSDAHAKAETEDGESENRLKTRTANALHLSEMKDSSCENRCKIAKNEKHRGGNVTQPTFVPAVMKYRSLGTDGCARVRLTVFISDCAPGFAHTQKQKSGPRVVVETRCKETPHQCAEREQSEKKQCQLPENSKRQVELKNRRQPSSTSAAVAGITGELNEMKKGTIDDRCKIRKQRKIGAVYAPIAMKRTSKGKPRRCTRRKKLNEKRRPNLHLPRKYREKSRSKPEGRERPSRATAAAHSGTPQENSKEKRCLNVEPAAKSRVKSKDKQLPASLLPNKSSVRTVSDDRSNADLSRQTGEWEQKSHSEAVARFGSKVRLPPETMLHEQAEQRATANPRLQKTSTEKETPSQHPSQQEELNAVLCTITTAREKPSKEPTSQRYKKFPSNVPPPKQQSNTPALISVRQEISDGEPLANHPPQKMSDGEPLPDHTPQKMPKQKPSPTAASPNPITRQMTRETFRNSAKQKIFSGRSPNSTPHEKTKGTPAENSVSSSAKSEQKPARNPAAQKKRKPKPSGKSIMKYRSIGEGGCARSRRTVRLNGFFPELLAPFFTTSFENKNLLPSQPVAQNENQSNQRPTTDLLPQKRKSLYANETTSKRRLLQGKCRTFPMTEESVEATTLAVKNNMKYFEAAGQTTVSVCKRNRHCGLQGNAKIRKCDGLSFFPSVKFPKPPTRPQTKCRLRIALRPVARRKISAFCQQ